MPECWIPTTSCLSAMQGHFVFLFSYGTKPAFILRYITFQSNHTISKQLRFTLGLHERKHIFRSGLMVPEGELSRQKKYYEKKIFLLCNCWHYYSCPHPSSFACLHQAEFLIQSKIRAAHIFIIYISLISYVGGHMENLGRLEEDLS